MFKPTQPSPERSQREWIMKELGKSEPEFETIVDFAEWIDEQLSKLESNHEAYFTSQSMRSFFERG